MVTGGEIDMSFNSRLVRLVAYFRSISSGDKFGFNSRLVRLVGYGEV